MTTKRKKIWTWIGGIIGAFVILVVTAALILSARWKPLLSEKIKTAIYNGSHHLYKIEFSNIRMNLLTGSIAIDNVTLIPDSTVYTQLQAAGAAPANVFEGKLQELQINRAGILTAYFRKKIEISSIVLNKPSINLTFNKIDQHPDKTKYKKDLYQQISSTLKSIHVKNIKIIQADFDYINKRPAQKTVNRIKQLNVNITDFLLDSLSGADTSRFFYTKDISFEVTGYKSLTKDKMYTLKVDTVQGKASTKSLTVKGLKLIPMYPELAFSRKFKVQKDRYDLDFSEIVFSGFDYFSLSTDQKIQARALQIGRAKVNVFMSRESPAPPGLDKARNYPHMALKRFDIQTLIDTIQLKNIDVSYAEYNPASKKTGSVAFKGLNGSISNVTNDSLQLIKNHHAIANLNTRLMGSGQLNVRIDFNLTDKNGAFTYSGNLGNFDFRQLNPLSTALGLVEIESGQVQRIDFKVNGNTRNATGNLQMRYSDLKVKLLSDNIDGKGTKEKGFLSFLANKLLIKDANPLKGEAPRTATMQNNRIPSASFFNLMWKTLFVGIKEIVGVGIVPEKNPVKQQKVIAKKIKDQKKADKQKNK